MNKDIFLKCLEYTGVNTGNSVLGVYSFDIGFSQACLNLLYPIEFSYVNGLPVVGNYYGNFPYNAALPLMYNGVGYQPQGNLSSKDVYHIDKNNFEGFNALISMNHSGCLNTKNNNYILFSTTSGMNNSGIALGITPSSRLFLMAPEYFYTIPEEITSNDFVFVGIKSNRFVNFGFFNIKNNTIYNHTYDNKFENLNIEKLYFGGLLSYLPNYTGYSGRLNEIYLLNEYSTENLIKSCIECSYATGFNYNIIKQEYTGFSITGSYWTGIKENQITGFQIVSGNYIKTNNSEATFYYDSGISGDVQIYESLMPLVNKVSLTGYFTGIEPQIDIEKIYSQTKFNLFFDLGLESGDIIEIYTYKKFNPNVNLEIENDIFPFSNKYVQVFGNGLAETISGESKSGDLIYFSDYYTGLKNGLNKVFNFDSSDILLYDLYPANSITVPYNITGCKLSSNSSNEIIELYQVGDSPTGDTSGKIPPFNYDVYLNGKKLISGLDYTVKLDVEFNNVNIYSNHILFSGENNLLFNLESPQELKLIPSQDYDLMYFQNMLIKDIIANGNNISENIKNKSILDNAVNNKIYIAELNDFVALEFAQNQSKNFKFKISDGASSYFINFNKKEINNAIGFSSFEQGFSLSERGENKGVNTKIASLNPIRIFDQNDVEYQFVDDFGNFVSLFITLNPSNVFDVTKNLFKITNNTNYITGLYGFSEQIWKNGIRQKNKIDYFVKNSCTFNSGEYPDSDYEFQIFNSISPLVNTYINSNLSYLNDLVAYYDFEIVGTRLLDSLGPDLLNPTCRGEPYLLNVIKDIHRNNDLVLFGPITTSIGGKNNNGLPTKNPDAFAVEPAAAGGLVDAYTCDFRYYFDLIEKSYTISFWFKYPSDSIDQDQTLISWGFDPANDDVGMQIFIDYTKNAFTNGQPVIKHSINNINQPFSVEIDFAYDDALVPFSKDAWYHVVASYNKFTSELKLTMNGIKDIFDNDLTYNKDYDVFTKKTIISKPINIRTYTLEGIGSSNRALVVGRNTSQIPYQSNVMIDEVALWYRTLSENEILNLYNFGNGKFYNDFFN